MHSYNHRREATGSVAEPRQKNDSLSKTYSGTHNLGTLDHTDGTLNDVWRGQGSQKSLSDHLADEVVRPVHQDQVRSDARSSDWRRRGSSQHRMSARKEYGQVRHESDTGAFHPNDQLASYEDPCLRPDNRQLFDQAKSAQHKKGSDSTFKSYQPLRFSANQNLPGQTQHAPNRPPVFSQRTPFSSAKHAAPQPAAANQAQPPLDRNQINPTGPRPGFEALKDIRPPQRPLSRTVSAPPAPAPTEVYLAQSKLPVITREATQRLLLVLDLNGTLIVRPRRSEPAKFRRRPGLDKFFNYIFDNHTVMIYTSSQRRTVNIVLPLLFSKQQRDQLTAVWTRDKLDLTPEQFKEKVQVYKRLEKIWADSEIQASYPETLGEWDQTNTVLIDDSHLKALAQPHNLLHVPELMANFKNTTTHVEEQILDSLILKLEELKYQADVSRLIRLWHNGQKEPPKAPQRALPATQGVRGDKGNKPDLTGRNDTFLPSLEDELTGRMAHMSTDSPLEGQELLKAKDHRDDKNQVLLPGLSVSSTLGQDW